MIDPHRLDHLLNNARSLACEAGDKILHIYRDTITVEHKADQSPLTAADLAAHQHILRGLTELTPDIPVLSEESKAISFATRARWGLYWLVDPLDGTREFIKKNDEFTVNIALIDQHTPILGVVMAPALGRCYYATHGSGAYCHTLGGAVEAIHTRTPCPSKPTVVGSRSHGLERLNAWLAQLDSDYELISVGSALKFCLVAEGKADLYPRLGPTSEWDTAAAQCIVHQAGGQVLTLDGKPLRYNTKDSLLNPEFLVTGDPSKHW
ncbi:3'(2'),5'-bisphosphate nucleotidase CysQ [Thiorhodospira sibirica]|uniref:3'(2'),5'-bisphosphate nucleotidase CysQ n=1 Tax=Thiorhodospira sibirica TaxID=154347 RepID=UPI00022C0BA5|nr:3'(2'),5'-bisphosphate nucleotidase CysQ [Thiorhodospira sibirica]